MWTVEKVSRSEEKKKLIYLSSAKKILGKIISLLSAKEKHSANLFLCRVPLTDTRQTPNGQHTPWRMFTWRFFAECLCFAECFFSNLPSGVFSALGKDIGMPSAVILPSVWFLKHSTNNFFVECPIKRTRQTFWHSANLLFFQPAKFDWVNSTFPANEAMAPIDLLMPFPEKGPLVLVDRTY